MSCSKDDIDCHCRLAVNRNLVALKNLENNSKLSSEYNALVLKRNAALKARRDAINAELETLNLATFSYNRFCSGNVYITSSEIFNTCKFTRLYKDRQIKAFTEGRSASVTQPSKFIPPLPDELPPEPVLIDIPFVPVQCCSLQIDQNIVDFGEVKRNIVDCIQNINENKYPEPSSQIDLSQYENPRPVDDTSNDTPVINPPLRRDYSKTIGLVLSVVIGLVIVTLVVLVVKKASS